MAADVLNGVLDSRPTPALRPAPSSVYAAVGNTQDSSSVAPLRRARSERLVPVCAVNKNPNEPNFFERTRLSAQHKKCLAWS